MQDVFGRRFPYLRLSVTEACNFRCRYCLPDGYRKVAPHHFLSVAEISRLMTGFTALGVRKVRLTGGEPTVRKDLGDIIGTVAGKGLSKIALTTNGWNLDRRLDAWMEAGLTHLNVSVDSLDPGTFERLTGHDDLAGVLDGVERALSTPDLRVKINAVLLKDTVGAGFDAYADFVRERDVCVRFIELMRTADNAAYFDDQHVGGAALRSWLGERGWSPLARQADDGPATEFSHPEFRGRFGLIAPYAPGFCDQCNRLRVTARGRLRLCLFGSGDIDLRDLLQSDDQTAELQERVVRALLGKKHGHALHASDPGDTRNLSAVGG